MNVGERLITEGFNAADNSLLVPVILPIAPDNCQNSVVGEAAAAKRAIACEGFFRLTVEEFCENAIATIKQVMFKGDRILLQQAGEDIAAIIVETEFRKLDYLMAEFKPSQFLPDEEEYYEDEGGIHCFYLDEVLSNFICKVRRAHHTAISSASNYTQHLIISFSSFSVNLFYSSA